MVFVFSGNVRREWPEEGSTSPHEPQASCYLFQLHQSVQTVGQTTSHIIVTFLQTAAAKLKEKITLTALSLIIKNTTYNPHVRYTFCCA